MKITRLGYTESTLLYIYYYRNILKIEIDKSLSSGEKNMINWLYSTSGFYDKTIEGQYFNFNPDKCLNSEVYNTYVNIMLGFFNKNKLNNVPNNLFFHDPTRVPPSFLHTYGITGVDPNYDKFISFISDKNILIINPMSELMMSQYNNKNVNKIYPNFPSVKSITIYKNPYTFMNNGPDNNILETARKIADDIINMTKNIDNCHIIISGGAYSYIIASYIDDFIDNYMILGGHLLTYFGIKHGRDDNSAKYNEYWVSVPEHLKPVDYQKIENGCYW